MQKNSIGNNSGSVKETAVKFAYSRGFSAVADRMVLPPSLSRDRKWPRPPIRRMTAPWLRVNGGIQAGTVDNGPENVFRHRLAYMRYERKFSIFSTMFRKNTRN